MASVTGGDASSCALQNENRLRVKPGFQAKEWTVLSRCGTGFGDVYKVKNQKTNELGAMKIEHVKKINESALTKESKIYKALSRHSLIAKHVSEMIAFDKNNYGENNIDTYFLVTAFLGPNLKDVKRTCGNKLELSTVLRIGIQSLLGIKMLHDCGYVHRHLRPSSFMLGPADNPERCRIVYLNDFQIARKFLKRAKNNIGIYREEREPGSVRMHGYIRYVSVCVHNGNEHRCRDDLWSWVYILAELLDNLPWQNIKVDPTKIHAMKMTTPDSRLFSLVKSNDILAQLLNIIEYIRTIHADLKPDYAGIYRRLKNSMNFINAKFSDPYDWEKDEQPADCFLSEVDLQRYFAHEELQIIRKGDNTVEIDPTNVMLKKDDSSTRVIRKQRRKLCNTESLEIPSFIDIDITQHSATQAIPSNTKTIRRPVAVIPKEKEGLNLKSLKKKVVIKDTEVGKSTAKKNPNKKIPPRKKPPSPAVDKRTVDDNNNIHEGLTPFHPNLAKDEKQQRHAAEKEQQGLMVVGKSVPQQLAQAPPQTPHSPVPANSSSKRRKREKKDVKKEGSKKKKKNKKKKHFKDDDRTVDKTAITKETSSDDSSSESDDKNHPTRTYRGKKKALKLRAIKSAFPPKEQRKKSAPKENRPISKDKTKRAKRK